MAIQNPMQEHGILYSHSLWMINRVCNGLVNPLLMYYRVITLISVNIVQSWDTEGLKLACMRNQCTVFDVSLFLAVIIYIPQGSTTIKSLHKLSIGDL